MLYAKGRNRDCDILYSLPESQGEFSGEGGGGGGGGGEIKSKVWRKKSLEKTNYPWVSEDDIFMVIQLCNCSIIQCSLLSSTGANKNQSYLVSRLAPDAKFYRNWFFTCIKHE